MDLNELSDQLNEKLKETSAMTRTLACRILERVREFKENFSGWDTVTAIVPGADIARKVYHRQPKRTAAGKAKNASNKAKKSQPGKSSSKGRAKRKK